MSRHPAWLSWRGGDRPSDPAAQCSDRSDTSCESSVG